MTSYNVSPTELIAKIATAQNGDIIDVTAGTLVLSTKMVINKQLQIIGTGIDKTIIDAKNLVHTSDWENGAVELRSDNIVFRGFSIINSKIAGIIAVKCNNLNINNCKTYNTYGSGIQVHAGSNIRITNIEIGKASASKMPDGKIPQEALSISGRDKSTGDKVSGIEVSYCYVHDAAWDNTGKPVGHDGGIYIKQGIENADIHHNYVYNGYGTGVYIDAWDRFATNIKAHHNICEKMNTGPGIGITPEQGGTCKDIEVYENIVYNNNMGIASPNTSRLGDVTNLAIHNNLVYKNKQGILIGRNFANIPTFTNVNIANNILDQNVNNTIQIDDRVKNVVTLSGNVYTGTNSQQTYEQLKAEILDGEPVSKYKCSGSPNYECIQDPNGQYSSLTECQLECCQQKVQNIQHTNNEIKMLNEEIIQLETGISTKEDELLEMKLNLSAKNQLLREKLKNL